MLKEIRSAIEVVSFTVVSYIDMAAMHPLIHIDAFVPKKFPPPFAV
jgi:hypothetical protein